MTVTEAISWLRARVSESRATRIVIVSAQQDRDTDEPRGVISVSMDDSDAEVHLLVNHPPWKAIPQTASLTVDALLAHLAELPTRCESYHLVSGTWRELDEEHVARIDWPLEDVVTVEGGACIAFIERRNFNGK